MSPVSVPTVVRRGLLLLAAVLAFFALSLLFGSSSASASDAREDAPRTLSGLLGSVGDTLTNVTGAVSETANEVLSDTRSVVDAAVTTADTVTSAAAHAAPPTVADPVTTVGSLVNVVSDTAGSALDATSHLVTVASEVVTEVATQVVDVAVEASDRVPAASDPVWEPLPWLDAPPASLSPVADAVDADAAPSRALATVPEKRMTLGNLAGVASADTAHPVPSPLTQKSSPPAPSMLNGAGAPTGASDRADALSRAFTPPLAVRLGEPPLDIALPVSNTYDTDTTPD